MAPDRPFDLVLSKLHDVKLRGRTAMAHCPAHEDRQRSLSVTESDGGKVLIHCFAGCSTETVVERLGLSMGDLFTDTGDRQPRQATAPVVTATYDYLDAGGKLVAQVVRMVPKTFRQRRPDPGQPGGYSWSTAGLLLPVYRLPRIVAAPADEWIYVVEGEKDVHRAEALGLVATCNPGGAGKFREHHADQLAGRRVVILPDNDTPGRKHADDVARLLHGKAAEVRTVELPGLPEKGDLSDFLDAGGTVEQLMALVAAAGPFDPNGKPAEGVIAPRLNARRLVTVAAKGVEWIEPGYLAKGMLHGLYGDPSLGKSAFMAWAACRLSRGRALWSGDRIEPVASLFVLSEDSPEHTVRPRVDLFDGDPDLIHVVETVTDATGAEVIWDAMKHGELVAEYVREHGIGLVVIDALSSAMGGADRNAEGQVRDSLTRLRQIASDTGAAIVGIGHLTKGTVGRAAYHAVMGSVAFVAVPRVVWMLVPHPDDDQLRITGVAKLNLGPKPPSYEWRWPEGQGIEVVGESAIGIEEAFASPGGKRASVEDAVEALGIELAGGMRRIHEVEEAMQELGISKATVRRAKAQLGILARKIDGTWYWQLPAGEPQPSSCSTECVVEQVETDPAGQGAQASGVEHPAPEQAAQGAQPNTLLSNMDDHGAEEVQEWL